MRTLATYMTCTALVLALAGCEGGDGGGEGEKESAPAPTSAPASPPSDSSSLLPDVGGIELVAFQDESVEVGCGMCVYDMPGVESCATAVLVAGKPVIVQGVGTDAHAHGLCAGSKTAVVSGKVVGDHFETTKLELQ